MNENETEITNNPLITPKRIIIILVVILLIFAVVYLVILNWPRNEQNGTTETPNSIYDTSQTATSEAILSLPTGIIVPTTAVAPNDLDIVSVSPVDGSSNTPVNSKIEIIFNRNFNFDEISFLSVPNIIADLKIDENKLTATPTENLTPGTLYSFRINFLNDVEKIRLYRFTTQGQPNPILPDTREESAIREFENSQRINYPDIFVANNTPFENADFIANSDFEPTVPSRYFLIITSKNNNRDLVTASVNVWLQSLGLTAQQINSLDIRYR